MSAFTPKRLLRWTAKTLAGLLLLCLLVVAGVLVWLRTPHAERYLVDIAVQALAQEGLTLSIGSVEGPLPTALLLRDVRLEDANGPLLNAQELEVTLSPQDLLHGTVTVDVARVDGAELFRLPATSAQPSAAPEESSEFTLPVGVRVNALRVANIRIHRSALPSNAAPEPSQKASSSTGAKDVESPKDTTAKTARPKNAEAGDAEKPLLLSADGFLQLESTAQAGRLSAALLGENGEGLRISVELTKSTPTAGVTVGDILSPETLRVVVEAREAQADPAHGVLAALSGSAQPAYDLQLQGDGSLQDWRATVAFKLGRDPQEIFSATLNAALRCRTGSLWQDMVIAPDWQINLHLAATPGQQAPAQLRSLLGADSTAELALQMTGETATGSAAVTAAGSRLSLENLVLAPEVQKASGAKQNNRRLSGRVLGTIPNVAEFVHTLAPAETKQQPLPLRSATAGLDFSVLLGRESVEADVKGEVQAVTDAQPYTLNYSLAAQTKGTLAQLTRLQVEGLGLTVTAAGVMDSAGGGIQADLTALAADHAPWQLLLAELAGLDPTALGGELSLAGHMDLPAAPASSDASSSTATGTFTLQGKDMRWPSPELKQTLGETLALRVDVSGGGSTPYVLSLKELNAGVLHAAGQVEYTAAVLAAGGVSTAVTSGNYAPAAKSGNNAPTASSPSLPNKKEGTPAASASVPSPLPDKKAGSDQTADSKPSTAEHIAAQLTVSIDDLAPLGAAVSGPLTAKFTALGPLQSLTAGVLVSSPQLIMQGTPLREPTVRLNALLNMPPTGGLRAEGKIEAGSADAFGAPAAFSTAWQVSAPGGAAPLTAALRDLQTQALGMTLRGNLQAELGDSPLLEGSFLAEVNDWSGIAKLGSMPLKGERAQVDLRLSRKTGGQEASLSFRLPSLAEQTGGFALQGVEGTLLARNVFHEPAAKFELRTAKGSAGPLVWDSGTSQLTADARTGTFSLNLRQNTGRATTKPAAKTASGGGGTGGDKNQDILALRGGYDTTKDVFRLEQFSMWMPERQVGLRLQEPVTASLAKGMQARGIKMAFLPGGNLTADVGLTPGSTTVTAALQALPIAFFRMFTDTPLPAGTIDLRAAYDDSARGPRGTVSLTTRISAPPNSGAGKPAASLLSFQTDATIGNAGGRLALRGSGTFGSGEARKEGNLNFTVPLKAQDGGFPSPDMAAPLTASLNWSGSVTPLWQAVPLPDRSLSGQAQVNVTVSGTTAAPKTKAEAFLAGGRYEDKLLGVLLTDINLEARAAPDGAARIVLAAGDGQDGTLALEGAVTGGKNPSIDLRGQIKHLQPLHRDDLSIMLSGLFGVHGLPASPAVTAEILVERGEVTLLDSLGAGSVETLPIADGQKSSASSTAGPTLAVSVDIPSRFFIRGRGLDSEWEGKLHINGPAAEPAITGSLRPVRGYLELLSKPFAFTGGEIEFAGGSSINPGVNLELTYTNPELEAVIEVGGTAKKPALTLTSRPSLPQDEVLAHVLFGKSTSDLSRFESLQLANSMRELSGGGAGFSPLTSVQKNLGLDVLRVGGSGGGNETRQTSGMSGLQNMPGAAGQSKSADDAEQAPSLEAGKYINDSIYVGVDQGMTQESTGVRVEVELFPNVMLEGRTSTKSSQMGLGWKKDY